MEHTNKIAKEILDKEFGDYHYNSWHYDREYKMIVEAINEALSITAVVQVKPEKFKCLARNPNPDSAFNYECDKQCEKCAKL